MAVGGSADHVSALGVELRHVTRSLEGEYDYIHAFVVESVELPQTFSKLKPHLHRRGMLWISWPKGGSLGSDLSLGTIINVGYKHGLVESKTISVNATWSAIKFTFPVAGKRCQNSYGRLPRNAA